MKGNQVFKFDQNGKLLLTLGKAGVGKAGTDTFLQPAACRATPDGNILIADGHWPRPTTMQQDGDRLVWFTRDGKFIKEFGRHGRKPGEFIGPHGLAFDSKGRLFVADRSNNRVQIFDKDMNVIDSWTHFGRPSGIWILKDDTLIVSDWSPTTGLADLMTRRKVAATAIAIRLEERYPHRQREGWITEVLHPGHPAEGLAADELGNISGGLTAGCDVSKSGGCLRNSCQSGRRSSALSVWDSDDTTRNAHHMATDSKGICTRPKSNPGSRVQRFIFKGVKPQSTVASR